MDSVTAEIQRFFEEKIKETEVFSRFLNAPEDKRLSIYYEIAPENPRRPYLRYMIQRPVETDRDLELNFSAYLCVINVNIVGNSIDQVRELAESITETFNKLINVPGFPNIEDVTCQYPDESKSYDADTKLELFETAQEIQFYFVI